MAEEANAEGRTPKAERRLGELGDFANRVAIVVSSCDAFFDAWRPFTIFFRTFWPDCPFKVHLVTNELRIRSDLLTAIAVGPDRGWASNLKRALEQITTSHVFYLQEDYFLNARVDSERLADDFRYGFENSADSLCFRARSNPDPGFKSLNEHFGIVPRDSDGRTRCQATLWKRDVLRAILREDETAWDFEAKGSERTRDLRMLSYARREEAPVSYVMSAISRGLWMPAALQLCREHKVPLIDRFRPDYSANKIVQRFRRARGRRALARALENRRGHVIDLDQP